MLSTTRLTLLIATLLLSLSACDTPKNGDVKHPDENAGADGSTPDGDWRLTTLNGQPPLASTEPTLRIHDEQAGGDGGCNGFGGEVDLDGDQITFNDLAITSMACMGEGIHEQESVYMDALYKAKSWSRTGDTLTLSGDGGTLVYSRIAPTPDSPITGVLWNGHTFLEGELASSLVADTAISITLAEDGSITGSTGCNGFGGSYTLDGETIAITVGHVTERACMDPAKMEQESNFLTHLGRVERARVDGNNLALTTADGKYGVVFSAEP